MGILLRSGAGTTDGVPVLRGEGPPAPCSLPVGVGLLGGLLRVELLATGRPGGRLLLWGDVGERRLRVPAAALLPVGLPGMTRGAPLGLLAGLFGSGPLPLAVTPAVAVAPAAAATAADGVRGDLAVSSWDVPLPVCRRVSMPLT